MTDFFDEPEKAPENNCWEDEQQPFEFELTTQGNQGNESPWWQDLPEEIAERWQQLQEATRERWDQWWQEQQDKMKDAWNEWWGEQQDKITDALNNWWEDFQRQLAEWFEQQLMQWLNQLCGSAFLPGGILASVWIYHGKRRKRA